MPAAYAASIRSQSRVCRFASLSFVYSLVTQQRLDAISRFKQMSLFDGFSATVRGPHPGIVLNEIFEGDGDILFEHACKLGCEGIVSKRLGSPYRSGRSPHWVKVKNPSAPAVRREDILATVERI